MYNIETPKTINQIIALYYRLGMWNDEGTASFCRIGFKLFHIFYYISFVLSIVIGACVTKDKDELIVLAVVLIIATVHSSRLAYIIWKKNKILSLIHELSTHSTYDREEYVKVNNKLKFFGLIAKAFISMCCSAIPLISIHPILSGEKLLIFNVGLPLFWKNSSIAFWITHVHIVFGGIYSICWLLLSIVVWFLMMNGAIKYEMLGNRLRNMGVIRTTTGAHFQKVSKTHKERLFLKDLLEAIKSHQKIKVTIAELSSTFSDLFFIQVVTSSIAICGSVYILAFRAHENLLLMDGFYCIILINNLFDVLVVMYLGNEIKLSSDRLSYCLFESQWIDYSNASNKYILVMTEVLKKPQELIIGKLYPLNLNTYTSIVNGAYSLFNILQNSNLGK